MLLLGAKAMERLDRKSIRRDRIPSARLMENAGKAVFKFLQKNYRLAAKPIFVFCGPGNNGGDGFVIARLLKQAKARPVVLCFSDPSSLKGDAALQLQKAQALKIPVLYFPSFAPFERMLQTLPAPFLIVDALFGTGLSRPLRGAFAQVIDWMNWQETPIVSVDLPSGLDADTGDAFGSMVTADHVVTFGFAKPGLFLGEGSESFRSLTVAPIGLSPRAVAEARSTVHLIDRESILPLLRPRPKNAHKGNFGHVFTIAGSTGKWGAAVLAAHTALRAGCGLSTLLLPQSVAAKTDLAKLELMVEPIPDSGKGFFGAQSLKPILGQVQKASALAIGPGLGTAPATRDLVRQLLRRYPGPVILDADGLNCIASNPKILLERKGPTLLTPHPGEMGRLIGKPIPYVQSHRLKVAREFAQKYRVHLLLKGYRSILALPNGEVWINPTGSSAMASAGQGDVLTGIYAGLWAQFPREADAVLRFGCFLHGLVGDQLARRGERVVLAGDIAKNLGLGYSFLKKKSPVGSTVFY